MDILLFFFVFVSAAVTGQEMRKRVCEFNGKYVYKSYTFSISDVIERCDIVAYGHYYFDGEPPVEQEDLDAIKALVAANKVVYIMIAFQGVPSWGDVIYAPDVKVMDPFVLFLNDYKISGIYYSPFIYDTDVKEYPQKMVCFVNKMKADVPNIKVGLDLVGSWYKSYQNRTKFDFTITNTALDFYIIDSSNGIWGCNEKILKYGRNPIINPDKNDQDISSMEEICTGIAKTLIEQTKIYVRLLVSVTMPDTDTYESKLSSYSTYCSSKNTTLCLWCKDSTEVLHCQGQYVKSFFPGILLSTLDTDDFKGACGCQKFPASNAILDGWEGKPHTGCPRLDGP